MSGTDSSATSSKRSSFSSIDGPVLRFNRAENGTSTASSSSTSSPAGGVLTDVLCRDFPKPTEDINVAEMIARAPQRHSLRYYVKNARDLAIPNETKEQHARKLAETKKKLLEAKEELNQIPLQRS